MMQNKVEVHETCIYYFLVYKIVLKQLSDKFKIHSGIDFFYKKIV